MFTLLHIRGLGLTISSICCLCIASNDGLGQQMSDTIRVHPETKMLPEVKIVATKPFMKMEGDKRIFQVSQIAGVEGGNAANVLQAVPLLSVDRDGNVSIRGNAAAVLIDGKPSPFSDLATTLEMIQASAIDKVEVIANPSAKYEAEGQGGIVNIVLKKETETGLHGVVNLDVGSNPDEHVGGDLSYRGKHFRLYGNLNYHTRTVEGQETTDQLFGDVELTRSAENTLHNQDMDSRLGLDIYLSDRSTLSFTGGYAHHYSHKIVNSDIDSGIWKPYAADAAETFSHNRNYQSTVDFVHRFARQGELIDASFSYSRNRVLTDNSLHNTMSDSLFLENSHGKTNPALWTSQVDYTLPIGKGKLEAGYKGDYRTANNDVLALAGNNPDTALLYSAALSSRFNYSSAVHALYGIWSGNAGPFHYSGGLRTEYALEAGNDGIHQINVHQRFFNLFPSVFVSRDLSDGQYIGLSYATRIGRPEISQLLPYVDNSNPLNYTTGNPELSPAYTHRVEAAYNHNFSKTGDFVSASVYYSRTSDNIQPVTDRDSTGVILTKPENIGHSDQVGSDLIYRFVLWRIIHFTTSVGGSFTRFPAGKGYWSGSMKLSGEIYLPAKFIFMTHGELSTPQAIPNGYAQSIKGLDMEVRHLFFKGRVTTSLIVSDVFDDREDLSVLRTPLLYQRQVYREDARMLHLHVSYHF